MNNKEIKDAINSALTDYLVPSSELIEDELIIRETDIDFLVLAIIDKIECIKK